MEILLHHYWGSNYAEKARLLLGLKELTWGSVIIPDIMPKPDLVAITGGYSKTPVMQIGADIYCDTKCIGDELEARFPEPTFYPDKLPGFTKALEYWADGALTLAGGRYLIGRSHERWRPEFHADRAALWGVPIDLERMARSAERYRQQLVVYLEWITKMLSDGRPFLNGERPGLADASVSHILWFLESGGPKATDVLIPFPVVQAWLARVRTIGHGTVKESTPAHAIEVARTSAPTTPACVDANVEGLSLGEAVSVRAEVAGRDPVVGSLRLLTRERVALALKTAAAGDVVVHFPRVGYVVSRA